MFTGLVSAIGRIASVEGDKSRRLVVDSPYDADTILVGASIAHNGVCLTVTQVEKHGTGSRWSVDVVGETLAKTTIPHWQAGQGVNLERSLTLGDELGGHMVYGHVDTAVRFIGVQGQGEAAHHVFAIDEEYLPFIAVKGSVALDGVSLTVASVSQNQFGVALVPHTLTVTTLGQLQPDMQVNLEVDIMARYAARLTHMRMPGAT